MHSITVFATTTFFYCVGTAMASQPDKVKLYGVSRNAAATAAAGSWTIREKKTEDGSQHKRSLQDWNTAFQADVAMPARLQSTMKKTSGGSERGLQTATAQCDYQDNGLLFCVLEDYPWEGAAVVFLDCPVSAPTVNECQSCAIVATTDDTLPECNSCSVCYDNVAYDCTNLFEGECVTQDCNGNCGEDPASSASMRKLGILSIAATLIAALGLF